MDLDLDSEDEDQDKQKSLESSTSNSTRIKSTIPTAAKLSTSQDSIVKIKPLASTTSTPLVKTKPSDKNKKKSKGNSNKIMSRLAAIVGFGDKLDEEGKRAIDQDIEKRK